MITPVGNNVTLDVLIARNSAIELSPCLAGVEFVGSRIARIPNGVAAFPRPSAFADIFRIMAPTYG